MSLQEWIVAGLDAPSTPRRVAAFVLKVTIEGVVFAVLAAIATVVLYLAAVATDLVATPATVVVLWAAVAGLTARHGWCFLTS